MPETLTLLQALACVIVILLAGLFLSWALFSRYRAVERAAVEDGRLPIITD